MQRNSQKKDILRQNHLVRDLQESSSGPSNIQEGWIPET